MNPEIVLTTNIHEEKDERLQLSDYQSFLKGCHQDHIKTLELLNIEP